MRSLLFFLSSFLFSIHVSSAQVGSPELGKDPVFVAVLSRRIMYPADAERSGVYAKIYAGFRIDKRGHIQDINILNPTKIGYGFERAVTNKLKSLPPLNPNYEGNYALPVTFALVDYTDRANVISPSGHLSNTYFKDRLLLSELKVIGSKTPIQKGNELAPYGRSVDH
ncbi:energy transducer TonB [Spirosoma spitsbergense]|uniref:energy transducer TonB n=1 Tax=Spirosoma spitsbergense TaxID=431554 RepID=UPI0012F94D48|nr:energy transducer TonB [Spirosoma spitsbergense]